MSNAQRLATIRQRCEIEGDHWVWTGALSDGYPRIWAPDYSRGGKMSSQPAHRAMWQMRNEEAVPKGFRVFSLCGIDRCISPECCICGTTKQWGEHMSRLGVHNTAAANIARKLMGEKNRKLTAAQILEAQLSDETGLAIAARFGCRSSLISKARRGQYQQGANPFMALLTPARSFGAAP